MPRKWQMERLEDRRLLAVDVQVLSGDLVVSGNATGRWKSPLNRMEVTS